MTSVYVQIFTTYLHYIQLDFILYITGLHISPFLLIRLYSFVALHVLFYFAALCMSDITRIFIADVSALAIMIYAYLICYYDMHTYKDTYIYRMHICMYPWMIKMYSKVIKLKVNWNKLKKLIIGKLYFYKKEVFVYIWLHLWHLN